MASPTDQHSREGSPARDDRQQHESGSGPTGSVVAFPVSDVARGAAQRQSGRGEKLGEAVPVSDPAVTIDHGGVSLAGGVTVWGMPGLSVQGGVIALQVEPRPAQRPRPRLVYDRGDR